MTKIIKVSKADANKAERAAEHFAKEIIGCIETRRCLRTLFNKVDFFGADVVGKKPDGSHCYIQVTSGQDQAVTARRRKMESHIWHETDSVIILQMAKQRVGRRLNYYFKVFLYMLHNGKRTWKTDIGKSYWIQSIKRSWFEVL